MFVCFFAGGREGSTLIPQVTNEFPEYGTVEEGAKAWEAPSAIHGEVVTCAPDGQPGGLLPPRPLENGKTEGDAAPFSQELHPFHKEEETVQLVDKQGGILTVSQDSEYEEPQGRENNAFGSETQMENESCVGRADEEVAGEKVLADQEKFSEMLLSSRMTAEKKLYWITEEDSTMILTVEIQPETSQATEEAHKKCEIHGYRPSEGSESKAKGTTSILRSAWANFEREFSMHDSDKMDETPERRLSKEMAVSKHVEFQGVEILWIQKAEEQKGIGHSAVNSVERRSFSRIPNDCTSSTVSSSLVGLPESSCSGSWESLRPLTSLAEGGEDEVFVEEEKRSSAEDRKSVLSKDR